MWHIRLLGGLDVRWESHQSVSFRSHKAEAMLAVLARRPGKKHSREALATLLWPESAPASARSNLRQTLKQLRSTLSTVGKDAICAEGDTLSLEPEIVDVDTACFDALSEVGTREALGEAADMYKGDFLVGVVPPAEPFGEWMALERMSLRERFVAMLEKLLPDDVSAGRLEQAIQRAVSLLALDPLQERIHRLLMDLYLKQGRRGAALEQYRACCAALQKDLGVRPEPETEALYREIAQTHRNEPPELSLRSERTSQTALEAIMKRPAVAVLPFANLNDDPDRTYFSDGVSEDIVTMLAGWRRFPLIASSSSLTYRDRASDIRRIGDELGAGYLVTGSVRLSGQRARINARLIESQSGYVHWTKRYDLDLDDIFKAQEEIAERIAAAIEPALESAELSRITTKRTEDVNAWDCFLQGISFLHRYTPESNALARKSFLHAIELDHNYSDAYSGLALSHLRDLLVNLPGSATNIDSPDRANKIELAFEAARKAVELDTNSSDAHLQVGTAYVWIEDLDSAVSETELAVELNPSNAHARMALGNRLDLIGRNSEGIEQMECALELNPRDLNRWNYMGYLSRAYLDARKNEVALSWARKALRLRPDQPEAHFRIAACLAHLDCRDEAMEALAECERLRAGFVAMKAAWQPYADPQRSGNYFAGLRRLSLID